MSSRRGSAYHEAGHAVVSVVLGFRSIKLVTILPGEGCEARVEYEPHQAFRPGVEFSPDPEEVVRSQVVGFFAGSFAQGRIDGDSTADDDSVGDYLKAGTLADPVTESEEKAQAYLRDCAEQAELLVAEHWAEVEAVAAALLERQALSGGDVVAIVESCRRHPA